MICSEACLRSNNAHYRSELSTSALAWLFFNMAVATTLRYVESDDPIRLDELRAGLKFASAGLLAGGRVATTHPATTPACRSSSS
ncbi:hypothetical protein MHPYR_420048 [uncultured Mycobacterium sp.]|uniref:Uncharacterized protein n=1 Tax=uncultured Mycobacterium sp. TaxID=171292 RepID=A0A1Y5PFF5_9MYCO|nr:hypothetical protein MHPYR_420048 [uncultured Mycobacterium sp.]